MDEASEISAHEVPRIQLRDVNDHITCFLCKGYYIDATTIVECLHSFCRSCIIKRLKQKCSCPICEVIINKAKPNLKPDKTLQDIVYKLVPGLHRDEMRRRREFYNHTSTAPPSVTLSLSPQSLSSPSCHLNGGVCRVEGAVSGADGAADRLVVGVTLDVTPEQRGEDNERVIYNATDPISVSLEYSATECDIFSTKNNNNIEILSKMQNDKESSTLLGDGKPPIRYLQCPAGVTVRLLKKFLIGKFDINAKQYHIDILYKSVPLPDDYKLMDIAYIYSWKQSKPMRIFYRVMDIKYAVHRFDYFRPTVNKSSAQPAKEVPVPDGKSNELATTKQQSLSTTTETSAASLTTTKESEPPRENSEKVIKSDDKQLFDDTKVESTIKVDTTGAKSSPSPSNNKFSLDKEVSIRLNKIDHNKKLVKVENNKIVNSDVIAKKLIKIQKKSKQAVVPQLVKTRQADVAKKVKNLVRKVSVKKSPVKLNKIGEPVEKTSSEVLIKKVQNKNQISETTVLENGKESEKAKENCNKSSDMLQNKLSDQSSSDLKPVLTSDVNRTEVSANDSLKIKIERSEVPDAHNNYTSVSKTSPNQSKVTPTVSKSSKRFEPLKIEISDGCDPSRSVSKETIRDKNDLVLKPNVPKPEIDVPLIDFLNSKSEISVIPIDKEIEKQKSLFLHTFQLIPVKELEQRKLELSRAKSLSPVKVSPNANKSTKLSPRKTSPKVSPKAANLTNTSLPKPPIATLTAKQSLPKTANKKQSVKSEVKTKPNNSADRPKRQYTFITRPVGKKARLQLEKVNQEKLMKEKLQKEKLEKLILQQTFENNQLLVQQLKKPINSAQQSTSNSNPSASILNANKLNIATEKRKGVTFKLDSDKITGVPADKCTNYANNPTSTNNNSVPTLKSLLFDNCNLNIPSSLSITLTESSNDRESNSVNYSGADNSSAVNTNLGGKRQSPPVNMYIEIFKIPDSNDKNPTTNLMTNNKQQPIDAQSKKLTKNNNSAPNQTNADPTNNLSKVITSLSSSNFVVHTTGIQSLGRKTPNTNNTSLLTSPIPVQTSTPNDKPKKIQPKTNNPTQPFIPKLAESPKATTGFQKMFEEAIKRKEAMKIIPTHLPTTSSTTSKAKMEAKQSKRVTSQANNSAMIAAGFYQTSLQTALDLSSNVGNKRNASSPTNKRPLSPPPNFIPKKRNAPIPILPKVQTNPLQNNSITNSSLQIPNVPGVNLLSSSPTPTTLTISTPSAANNVLPNKNSTNSFANPANNLNPNAIQQEFNLKNLAQLRHVMLLRQLELRKHLLSGNNGTSVTNAALLTNGGSNTLLEFENYMKQLQQNAAIAATAISKP